MALVAEVRIGCESTSRERPTVVPLLSLTLQFGNVLQHATFNDAEFCQVNDKTKRRFKVRSAIGTTACWRARLFQDSCRDRNGRTILIPEWYVRLRHDGVTKSVRLHESDKERAAEEALRLLNRMEAEGWNAVTSRQGRLPGSPTVAQFCDAFMKVTAGMERQPRAIGIRTYTQSFRHFARSPPLNKIGNWTEVP